MSRDKTRDRIMKIIREEGEYREEFACGLQDKFVVYPMAIADALISAGLVFKDEVRLDEAKLKEFLVKYSLDKKNKYRTDLSDKYTPQSVVQAISNQAKDLLVEGEK